jgi:lactoylglutathione lyase
MKKAIVFLLIICLACTLAVTAISRKTQKSLSSSFNHLALSVYDLKKTAEFYERVLYLKQIEDPFKDGKHIWMHIGEHNQLHLIAGSKREQSHPKDNHLSFTVSSVEEFVEHLKMEKVAYTSYNASGIVPVIRADGVKQVFFQDPDGFWIEVNNDRY